MGPHLLMGSMGLHLQLAPLVIPIYFPPGPTDFPPPRRPPGSPSCTPQLRVPHIPTAMGWDQMGSNSSARPLRPGGPSSPPGGVPGGPGGLRGVPGGPRVAVPAAPRWRSADWRRSAAPRGRCRRSPFGSAAPPPPAPSGGRHAPLRDRPWGDTAGTSGGHRGDTVGTSRGHCGDTVGTLWGHHQDIVGTLQGHCGDIAGTS